MQFLAIVQHSLPEHDWQVHLAAHSTLCSVGKHDWFCVMPSFLKANLHWHHQDQHVQCGEDHADVQMPRS